MTNDIRLSCQFCNAWKGRPSDVTPIVLAGAHVYLCPACSKPVLTFVPGGLRVADLMQHLDTTPPEVLRAVLECLTTSMLVDARVGTP